MECVIAEQMTRSQGRASTFSHNPLIHAYPLHYFSLLENNEQGIMLRHQYLKAESEKCVHFINDFKYTFLIKDYVPLQYICHLKKISKLNK